ncbi:MAG: thioredoxin family protein [Gemmatimonadetes bacterium]|nr:thioredoxin family protein [Gemmatimonadota bacterium]
MVKTASTMMPLGTRVPDFSLPEPATGGTVSRAEFDDAPALLVMVLSNHCPFVKHIAPALSEFAVEYRNRGVAIVGICANDVEKYPADSPLKMAEEVEHRGYTFPYLFDESQGVVKDLGAACTPDFFLFDGEGRLAYRGQFDGSRPSLDTPVTGEDLRAACDAVLAGEEAAADQTPSIGCNIKWKPGNEPDWFG